MTVTFASIAIALVDVPGGRLSSVRPARVETIGKTAKAIGQLQPINVEATEGGERPFDRRLAQVVGVAGVARQPARKTAQTGQQFDQFLFEAHLRLF